MVINAQNTIDDRYKSALTDSYIVKHKGIKKLRLRSL